MVERTSSRIDSPSWRVSNRNSSHNNDGTDVIDFRARGISVNDLKHVGSRTFFLESTEVLMYILTISEGTLQSESNRFCCHKARSRVNNDRFTDLVSAADLASMGSLEIIMDRRQVLEERDVEVVLIGVRLCRQKPVVDGVRVERVTRRRVGVLNLLSFISIDIPSELDRSTPTSFTFVSGLEGGHEVFRGTHASNQISGVHGRKEVDILLTGQVKGSKSSDCLIEVVVSELSGLSLVNRRQLDKVDGGTWCNSVVRIGFGLFSESKVLPGLDTWSWTARSCVRCGAHPNHLYPSREVPRRPRSWCRRRSKLTLYARKGARSSKSQLFAWQTFWRARIIPRIETVTGASRFILSSVQRRRYLRIRSIPSATFIRSSIPEIYRCMQLSRAI